MPAVRLLAGSILIISFGLACRGYTCDKNAFKSTFSKRLRFRVYV